MIGDSYLLMSSFMFDGCAAMHHKEYLELTSANRIRDPGGQRIE